MNALQIELIYQLFAAAAQIDLPLWLQGGWAIDAKLGRVTRDHEDIDIAYPGDRSAEFLALLSSLGFRVFEETSYGFLADGQGVLLDCEPCFLVAKSYELEGVPPGSCPPEPTGNLAGTRLRCVSWEAILWDYFYYLEEVPQSQWRSKDYASFALARASLGEARTQELQAQFRQHYSQETKSRE